MVKLIAGLMGSSVASGSARLSGVEQLHSFLKAIKESNVHDLDTARVYNSGRSEEDLGKIPEAKDEFSIATKAPGFSPGSLAFDNIINNCAASLAALKQEQLDIYYLHGPDRSTPLVESLRAINQLFQEGKLGAFGISNYHATEVEEILRLCAKHGFVRPSIYQGGYNPLLRAADKELFPLLRRHNISFYAYSPLAGGFFSRPVAELRNPPSGSRMEQMHVFSMMYVNDLSLAMHEQLSQACKKEGLTLKEAALRWMVHHSMLGADDGIIIGASTPEQVRENVRACGGGPLPSSMVELFEDIWRRFHGAGYSQHYSIPL